MLKPTETKLGAIYEPLSLKHIQKYNSKLISNYFFQVGKDHSESTLSHLIASNPAIVPHLVTATQSSGNHVLLIVRSLVEQCKAHY